MDDLKELEMMREQMASLNKKLDSQEIVNENMLRKAMSRRLNSINRDAIRVGFIALFGMFVAPFSFYYAIHTSIAFVIVTEIFFTISILYNWYCHRGLHSSDILTGNLIESSLRLQRFKKLYLRWELAGIPFLLIWGTWLFFEVQSSSTDEAHTTMLLVSAAIGAVIGLIGGLSIYFRVQRNASEVIDQIKELQKTDH